MRSLLKTMFTVEGFNVVGEAINGSEAVLLAGESQPQVIILDYQMPGMTGEETAKILRRITPDSRIVVFSAHLDGDPDWPDAFVEKTDISILVDTVQKVLGPPAKAG